MKKRYVVVLLVLAAFLGGLTFHQPVANAAGILAVRITGPVDSQGNVRTSQQGTVDVRVTNPTAAATGPRNRILADQRVTQVTPGQATTSIDTRGASSVRINTDYDSGTSIAPTSVCVQLLDAQDQEFQGGTTCHEGFSSFVVHDVLAPRIKVRINFDSQFDLDVRVVVVGLTD